MPNSIESKIITVRSQRVVTAVDLAALYGVSPKRLNEQVRRNKARFPEDFMFQLTIQEVTDLRSQIATSSSTHGGSRYRPYVFTEHGAIMAANVLNSRVAIDASIMLVRIFVRIRKVVLEHTDLKARLQTLEQRFAKGFTQHEEELQEIRFLIAKLEQPVDATKRRIGFSSESEG